MPSIEHENQIEAIKRQIESRGLNWKTKKNVEVHIPENNEFGLIDICGYKKEEPDSPAEVECYEIEHSDNSQDFNHWQSKRNKRKLEIIKNSFPPNVKTSVCQLSSSDNHLTKCKTSEPINNQQPTAFLTSIKQNQMISSRRLTPVYKIITENQRQKESPKTKTALYSKRTQTNRIETGFGTTILKRRMRR